MQIDFQQTPFSAADFQEWLKQCRGDLLFRPQSADRNLLAQFFRDGLGDAGVKAVICHGYCVRADGEETLFGASWPAMVSNAEGGIAHDLRIPPSGAERTVPVSLIRPYLLERIRDFV